MIGVGVFITTTTYYTLLQISSERIAKRTKVRYLEAILQQDGKWFDETNYNELNSKITKECSAI
jgi:hypothetical protein